MGKYSFLKSKLRKAAEKVSSSNFEMCLEWMQILIMRLLVVSESTISICSTKIILEVVTKIKRHALKGRGEIRWFRQHYLDMMSLCCFWENVSSLNFFFACKEITVGLHLDNNNSIPPQATENHMFFWVGVPRYLDMVFPWYFLHSTSILLEVYKKRY